jgi:hypothetical protein
LFDAARFSHPSWPPKNDGVEAEEIFCVGRGGIRPDDLGA